MSDQAPLDQSKWQELSPREVQIAEMIAAAYTRAEVSALLKISVKTFDTHRGKILKTLGLRCSVALTRYALRGGFVSGGSEADAPNSRDLA